MVSNSRPLSAATTDLDKLIYTMKTLHTLTDPSQYPKFWDEEWLRLAIDELDQHAMSPEERLDYEMTLSANALAIRNMNREIKEAENRKELEVKFSSIKRSLQKGLQPELVAEINEVSVEFILDVQKQLTQNNS